MVDGLTWNIVTIIIRNAPHPPSPDGPPWGSTQGQADAQAEDQHLGSSKVSTCIQQRTEHYPFRDVSQMEMDPF